jgi:hypothetical protein
MRSLALLLLLIWLPFQGVAAAAMPFCKHQQVPAGLADQHAGHHDPGHEMADHGAAPGGCDDCGVCQLACAPAVPSQSTLAAITPDTEHVAFECGALPPFVPDLLHPPPLAPA